MEIECHEYMDYENLRYVFGDVFNGEYRFKIIEVDGKKYLSVGVDGNGFCDGYYKANKLSHISKEDIVEVDGGDIGKSILNMINQIIEVNNEYGLDSMDGVMYRRIWSVERTFYNNPLIRDILLDAIRLDNENRKGKKILKRITENTTTQMCTSDEIKKRINI